MRFFTFEQDGRRGIGTRIGVRSFGVTDDHADYPGPLVRLIEDARLADAMDALKAHPLDGEIAYLPVLLEPGKIVCVGLNYSDHTRESGYAQPDYPTLFPRFVSSLIAADQPMIAPDISDTLDFEGEVAAIIGRQTVRVSPEAALDHVAGYALFNDGSVREYQFKTPQWTVGKNFDGTGAFGPDFVTADEVPPGMKGMMLETRLNGRVMQRASTDDLIFDVATLVSIISQAITLSPGDVIVTGTPAGIGHAREPKVYMRPGDIVEVEVEGLGILRNPIAAGGNARAAA